MQNLCVTESEPPLLMGDRSGAHEAPCDLGCGLRGMGHVRMVCRPRAEISNQGIHILEWRQQDGLKYLSFKTTRKALTIFYFGVNRHKISYRHNP
jgi:hypothetical protein